MGKAQSIVQNKLTIHPLDLILSLIVFLVQQALYVTKQASVTIPIISVLLRIGAANQQLMLSPVILVFFFLNICFWRKIVYHRFFI